MDKILLFLFIAKISKSIEYIRLCITGMYFSSVYTIPHIIFFASFFLYGKRAQVARQKGSPPVYRKGKTDGNLDPAEYDASPSPEYKELLQLISRNEEKLLATMTDTQKELFSRYQDCVREFQATAECLLFQNSFCLGAKMMMAIYEEQIH
jgi:hypothetical protein